MNTTTRPLTPNEITAIRCDLLQTGLSRIVNMRVQKQKYARGSISLYPSVSTKQNGYRWSEREFPQVLAFVNKHKLRAQSSVDYFNSEHVEAVYNTGFTFVAKSVDSSVDAAV